MAHLMPFTYRQGDSILHRLDVRLKFFIICLVSMSMLSAHLPAGFLYCLILLFFFKIADLKLFALLNSIKYFILLLCFVFIARALGSEPKLLLLDEPTASVDTPMQTGFYELLEKLKQEMAIVLVSHDLSAVSIYVDKIACINRRLFYHDSKELTAKDLEATYQCPVEMIAHGIPHRVLKKHQR